MMVNLLGCQEGGMIRGSGLALLLGYLGDGIGLQREVREVSGLKGECIRNRIVWQVAKVSSGRVDMR